MVMPLPCSSNPLNLLMSIFGGGDRGGDGGGGSIDCRVDVDAAASLMLRVDSWMTDLKAMMVMRRCVMIGSRMTYILYMYAQSQRRTWRKQKNKWDQDRSPITGNNHSKPALNYSQYHSSLQSQGMTARLTPVPEEPYVALFDVKLQFSKVPLLPVPVMTTAPPCMYSKKWNYQQPWKTTQMPTASNLHCHPWLFHWPTSHPSHSNGRRRSHKSASHSAHDQLWDHLSQQWSESCHFPQ